MTIARWHAIGNRIGINTFTNSCQSGSLALYAALGISLGYHIAINESSEFSSKDTTVFGFSLFPASGTRDQHSIRHPADEVTGAHFASFVGPGFRFRGLPPPTLSCHGDCITRRKGKKISPDYTMTIVQCDYGFGQQPAYLSPGAISEDSLPRKPWPNDMNSPGPTLVLDPKAPYAVTMEESSRAVEAQRVTPSQ